MNDIFKNRIYSALAVMGAIVATSAGMTHAGEDKPDFPPFEEITKDTKTLDGFITLYHNEKKDKLFARIPTKDFGKPSLIAISIASGPRFAGWQWGDAPVYWERIGKKLVLMAADPRYAKSEGATVEDVVARTYTDTIVRAVDIVTEIDGDPVIDLAGLLKVDLAGVGGLFGGTFSSTLARYQKIKNFEQNTEIAIDAPVMGKDGGPMVRVHYSWAALPDKENGFSKREADNRVGYFLVVQKDWATDHSEKTVFKRFINRWHLRKTEPDEAVSDVRPEDQIVFYIEKTVPVRFRRYVREGILEWNRAFEAAGLRNAVVVHQQTDTIHADKDPEDARYNFFRWIVTGSPFAMGPSRVNPFTGQILDADIIFDDSYIRYWTHDYDVHGPRATFGETDVALNDLTWDSDAIGSFGRARLGRERPTTTNAAIAKRAQVPFPWRSSQQDSECEIGIGAARSLAFSAIASMGAGLGELPEEFLGQAIKETVMHEVGHTLGLRHNFLGSSWLDLDELKNACKDGPRPTTGSVMDYNPYTYAQNAEEQFCFATPTLGPYDMWAIEYGYRIFQPGKDADGEDDDEDDGEDDDGEDDDEGDGKDESAPADEKAMLQGIARRSSEPALAYATDHDTSSIYPDPRVNRWDNGRDPLDFAKDQMSTAHGLWKDGLSWLVEDGKSLVRTRRALRTLLNQFGLAGRVASRVVGGQFVNRIHKGDEGGRLPLEVVSAEQQRAALKFLGETIFSDKFFDFSPELLNALAPGRWFHWDSDEMDFDPNFNIHDRVNTIQSRVLFQLMNPVTINRVYDAQMKVPDDEDALTVPELFNTLWRMVWKELDVGGKSGATYTDRSPMVSSFRRSLQREHLRRLITMVASRSNRGLYPDAQAVARLTLKNLADLIDRRLAQVRGKVDVFTRAHLVDSRAWIEKAMDAEFTANPSRRGGARIVLLGRQDER